MAQRRLAHEPGLSFVSSGRLAKAWGGHPAGAPYLVLRADCSLECSRARDLLGDIAGVTDLMWEHGWVGHRLPDGNVVTELRIFPGQKPSLLDSLA
jgi:hypothetical protein